MAADDLTKIAGQKVTVTKARKSIATFKLREGMDIGVKVTLRKQQMYEFLDRFINIALPRVRDFRGLSDQSFDGRGNYATGLKEHIVFPEIDYDKIDRCGAWIRNLYDSKPQRRSSCAAGGIQLPVPHSPRPAGCGVNGAKNKETEELMAKKSAIEKNNRRKRLVKQYAGKRAHLRLLPTTSRFRWKSGLRPG